MDLVYIPDSLAYGSFRNSSYRDYEQPWNQDYFNTKKPAYQRQRSESAHSSEKNCSLCRESKKRSLAVYIRSKSQRDACQGIHEEEEESDITHNKKNVENVNQKKSTKTNNANNEKP